jgi:hypothetical protein
MQATTSGGTQNKSGKVAVNEDTGLPYWGLLSIKKQYGKAVS